MDDGWESPDGDTIIGGPPDYHGDLNEVHELESKLDSMPIDQRSKYYDYLLLVTPGWPKRGEPKPDPFELDWKIVRATAPQRCESLLRTLNLWEEE